MITILAATYNDAKALKRSVDAIEDHLGPGCRLLVVDDGSDVPVGRAFPELLSNQYIRIVSNERNLGLTASLNRGMSMVDDGLVLRLDAGDEIMPEALLWLRERAASLPAISFMRAIVVDGSGKRIREKPLSNILRAWDFVAANPVVHGSVVFNREKWDLSWPPYNPEAVVAQDFELWLRAAITRPFIEILPFTGYLYRLGEGISSRRSVEQAKVCIRAFRAHFRKRPVTSIAGQLSWTLILLYRQKR